MLALLRSNQPITNLLLPLTGLLLGLTAIILNAGSTEWLQDYAWVQATFDWTGRPFVHYLFIILSGWLVNRLFIQHELSNDPTVMAGWILIFGLCCLPATDPVSPWVLGLPLLFVAINQILKVYRQNDAGDRYFNAGFFVGCASLFSLWFALFLLVLLIGVLYTRAANWRELTLPVVAFCIPALLFGSILWIFDFPLDRMLFGEMGERVPLTFPEKIFAAVTLVLSVAGILTMFNSFGSSSNKSKNSKAILFFFHLFLAGIGIFLYLRDGRQAMVFLMALSAMSIPYLFLEKGGKWKQIVFFLWAGTGLWTWVTNLL